MHPLFKVLGVLGAILLLGIIASAPHLNRTEQYNNDFPLLLQKLSDISDTLQKMQKEERPSLVENTEKDKDTTDILNLIKKDLEQRPPRNAFFDCGANKGDSLALFAGIPGEAFGADHTSSMFGKAKSRPGGWDTYSFEGHPKFDEQLLAVANEVRALPETRGGPFNVNIHNGTVVGGHSGEISFYLDSKSKATWGSSVQSNHPDVDLSKEGTIIKIPMIDLADFILTRYRITDYVIVKLDVEGAEVEIMQQLLVRGVIPLIDEIYVEFHGFANGIEHERSIRYMLSGAKDLFVGQWV